MPVTGLKYAGKCIVGSLFLPAEGTPTFLNVGAPYPDQLLTIVIWPKEREAFKGSPENETFGKVICVTGKIELYEGKPQIVLKERQQLTILSKKKVQGSKGAKPKKQ